jgi:hypothetical protein
MNELNNQQTDLLPEIISVMRFDFVTEMLSEMFCTVPGSLHVHRVKSTSLEASVIRVASLA